MTLRTVISCDQCNLRRIKSLEFRRGLYENTLTGRRLSNGRLWQEVDLDYALKSDWISSPEGQHICPSCQAENADHKRTYDLMIYK